MYDNEYSIEGLPGLDEIFKNDLQHLIFVTHYSKWDEIEQRQETWYEACKRATNALRYLSKNKLGDSVYQRIFVGVYTMKVAASQRLLSMPLEAIMRNNLCIFNCGFIPIEDARKTYHDDTELPFNNIAYLFYGNMNGIGFGLSLETECVETLPEIPSVSDETKLFVVPDTKEGWADSTKFLFDTILHGKVPVFDYSLLRPAGAKLKTSGGFSSGPKVLKNWHNFVIDILLDAKGRKLTSVELYDIITSMGQVAVAGGNRRMALLTTMSPEDKELISVKSEKDWYKKYPWRSASNNTVVTDNMSQEQFVELFGKTIEDGSGDPGFSSYTSKVPRKSVYPNTMMRSNACNEILLFACQLCNLTNVYVRQEDTPETITEKVELATIIGTIQSAATNYQYVPKLWKQQNELERLLGVSFSGIQEATFDYTKDMLNGWRDLTYTVNAEYADILGIEHSTSTTAIKPSGNSSKLSSTSAGIHYPVSRYLLNNIRIGKLDDVAEWLKKQNITYMQDPYNSENYLFTFPEDNSHVRQVTDVSAIEQLSFAKIGRTHV